MEEWWLNFYDEIIANVLLANHPIRTSQNADFIINQIGLSKNSLIFDQCSGLGDISIELGQRGMRVIGIDLAAAYVKRANQKAQINKVDCSFECVNADNFVIHHSCDAAINWHTSFGYHAEDSHNIKKLLCVYESLKPGGVFLLDYLFPTAISKNFKPRIDYTTTYAGEEYRIIRLSRLDFTLRNMLTDWQIISAKGIFKTTRTLTKLYLPQDLQRLGEAAGFKDIEFFGNNDGQALTIESPRCIALMRKPLAG